MWERLTLESLVENLIKQRMNKQNKIDVYGSFSNEITKTSVHLPERSNTKKGKQIKTEEEDSTSTTTNKDERAKGAMKILRHR